MRTPLLISAIGHATTLVSRRTSLVALVRGVAMRTPSLNSAIGHARTTLVSRRTSLVAPMPSCEVSLNTTHVCSFSAARRDVATRTPRLNSAIGLAWAALPASMRNTPHVCSFSAARARANSQRSPEVSP